MSSNFLSSDIAVWDTSSSSGSLAFDHAEFEFDTGFNLDGIEVTAVPEVKASMLVASLSMIFFLILLRKSRP